MDANVNLWQLGVLALTLRLIDIFFFDLGFNVRGKLVKELDEPIATFKQTNQHCNPISCKFRLGIGATQC